METPKRKPGRPSYVPSERERGQVRALSGMGVPDYEIAKLLGVSGPTMRKHFADELELGHIEANAKVAQSLYKMATDSTHPKAVTAAIFWLKARAGWRDTPAEGGKKEQREQFAHTAHEGTSWDGLLQ